MDLDFVFVLCLYRCVTLEAVEDEEKHILAVHSKELVNQIKTISSRRYHFRRSLADRFDSIYFNEGSSESAYLAAGSAIEVLYNDFLFFYILL
jgi:histone deacetylase 6